MTEEIELIKKYVDEIVESIDRYTGIFDGFYTRICTISVDSEEIPVYAKKFSDFQTGYTEFHCIIGHNDGIKFVPWTDEQYRIFSNNRHKIAESFLKLLKKHRKCSKFLRDDKTASIFKSAAKTLNIKY